MMAFCSRMYVPPSDAKAAAVDDMSSNNNIVLISYSILKQNKVFHEEAPFFCRGCSSALCHYSKLLSRDEYYTKMTEEEFPEEMDDIKKAELENKDKNGNFLKGKFIKDLQEGERGWICEFCDVHNRVPQSVTVPKTEDELYLLKKRNTIVQTTQFEETKTATTDGYHPEDETSMIFCIDVSGSMNVLHKVNNDGRTENSSRLKLVTDAVLKQMQTMSETHPNIKVGIIPFSSAVTIKGDGKENQVVVSTDLDNMGKLFSYSKMRGKALLTQSITESYDRLSVLIKRLQASGGTALGPALLCGLGLAVQGKPGSKIILCTDGLANVGLGSLENENEAVLKESQAFYDKVADIAAESGVSISIITIQGNACRVDALGPLTDKTAGTITRVDPANFDLSSIAANNLIATNVQLKAIIHEALTFQNEDLHSLHNNKSILIKNVGSVTQSNEAYFEYKVKNVQELKDNNMNLEALEWIPLQSQITYKDLRGNEFMRVICKKQELTRDEGEAQKDVKAEVLAGFVEKESANLVLQGKVKEAEKKNKAWSKRMEMVANDKGLNEQNKRVVEKFKAENEQMQLMIHESEAMQKPGSNQVQKDEINSKWYAIKQKKK